MFFVGCVDSGLCDGLIGRSEESYRVCVCVCVCVFLVVYVSSSVCAYIVVCVSSCVYLVARI